MPYLVVTVVPSTSGSRSRCTPCRDTSAPCISERAAILSISSMNTMPFCSAAASARVLISSSFTSFPFARLLDRHFDQVTYDGVDVAAHVADLRELGRFHLDEWSVGQARQTPRDLGLAHAGRADQQDVLGRDLLAQRLGHLLAAPA